MPVRELKFVAIPAGTPEARCRSCDQEVYWITTERGSKMPVSVDVDGAFCPTDTTPGSGISHFIDCPHGNLHRRQR